jgi:phenylpropionate dioxygenase-like ring-hydroxylating dioxygenase large terminal subunit
MSITDVESVLLPEERALLGKEFSVATGLPPRLYLDPDVYEAEKERIFRRQWMPVFHQTSLPDVGDYRVVDMWGESFIFVRAEDGNLRAFHNICRHRGAKLAVDSGNCKRLRCPYHAWTYDLQGHLTGAPAMAHLVRDGQTTLREVTVGTFLGFVFINDDGNAPPLSEKWAGLAEVLAPWVAVSDQLSQTYELHFPGQWNWKLSYENGIEGYHVLGSHLESAGDLIPGHLVYTDITEFEEWTGYYHPFSEGRNIRDTTGGSIDLENLPDWIDNQYRFYQGWPVTIFAVQPEAVLMAFPIPGATPGEVDFVWSSVALKASKDLPNWEAYKAEQMAFANTIQPEDSFPCETMWANLRSPAFKTGPYAKQETCVYQFDQWYLAQMGA